ncbi:hypothetical protein GGR56DRAFT_234391 [Xylariaceae sp. FL0804]|nr:hypothetical protein GGR56DRAFT_234391 [Xylariaceae sp. FL0804]
MSDRPRGRFPGARRVAKTSLCFPRPAVPLRLPPRVENRGTVPRLVLGRPHDGLVLFRVCTATCLPRALAEVCRGRSPAARRGWVRSDGAAAGVGIVCRAYKYLVSEENVARWFLFFLFFFFFLGLAVGSCYRRTDVPCFEGSRVLTMGACSGD